MPTDLRLRPSLDRANASILSKVEQMSPEESRELLGKIQTQLTGQGGVKSGVLTLVNPNRPGENLRFERKSWYQFRARSDEKLALTARVIETLIDRSGLADLADRRSFTAYVRGRSNRIGSQTLSRLLSRLPLNGNAVDAVKPNNYQATSDFSKDAIRKSVYQAFGETPQTIRALRDREYFLDSASEFSHDENYGELVKLLFAVEHARSESSNANQLSPSVLAKFVQGFFGVPPPLGKLSQFISNVVDHLSDGDEQAVDSTARVALGIAAHLEDLTSSQLEMLVEDLHWRIELDARAHNLEDPEDDIEGQIKMRHDRLTSDLTDELLTPEVQRLMSRFPDQASLISAIQKPFQSLRDAAPRLNRPVPRGAKATVLENENLDSHRFGEVTKLQMRGGSANKSLFLGTLKDASFHQVNMRGLKTPLAGIEASRLNFTQCDLTRANLVFTCTYPDSQLGEISFAGSDLTDANITIRYSDLNLPDDASELQIALIFDHLANVHRSSPLTLIDSIPNRFMGLKTKLMRETLEYLIDSTCDLIAPLRYALTDIALRNPAYLDDPKIREILLPVIFGNEKLGFEDRHPIALRTIAALSAETEENRARFVEENPGTVAMLLFHEYREARAIVGGPEQSATRDELRKQACALEALLHQHPSVAPAIDELKQAYIVDSAEYGIDQIAAQGKDGLMLVFPAGDEGALYISYSDLNSLLELPSESSFEKLMPCIFNQQTNKWELPASAQGHQAALISAHPLFGPRLEALKDSAALKALALALDENPGFKQYIVPALKGLAVEGSPLLVHATISADINGLYDDMDKFAVVSENENHERRQVVDWDAPILKPDHLASLRSQAESDGLIARGDNREWALYLFNMSTSIGRLSSNASLGSDTVSVDSLRFHAYKLMEAARAVDPGIIESKKWVEFGGLFKDENYCAEMLTRDMLQSSRAADGTLFMRLIPSHYRNQANG
jgi:hypothetical protein